jgi:hypothetical protein
MKPEKNIPEELSPAIFMASELQNEPVNQLSQTVNIWPRPTESPLTVAGAEAVETKDSAQPLTEQDKILTPQPQIAEELIGPQEKVHVESLVLETNDEPPIEVVPDEAAAETIIVTEEGDHNLTEFTDVTAVMGEFEESGVEEGEDVEWQVPAVFVAESIEPTGLTEPTEAEAAIYTALEPEVEALAAELPAPVEAMEAAIEQLIEALEQTESEEFPQIHEILAEIMALPDDLEIIAGEVEEAMEQKLEALFVRLFEATGIEYTPELVKAFVKLTRTHHLEELIAVEREEDSQSLPGEAGTREFLQKLRRVLGKMRRTVSSFYGIGKSVLRLYDPPLARLMMSA